MTAPYLPAFILALAESDPQCQEEAIVVSHKDRELLSDVGSVIRVLRNRRALECFNWVCPPDMKLDVDPWDPVPRPVSMGVDAYLAALKSEGYTPLTLFREEPRVVGTCLWMGSVWVAKEMWDETMGPLGKSIPKEDEVLDHLCSPTSPTHHRVIADGRILLRPFHFGSTLSDIRDMPETTVLEILARVARNLHHLHSEGVLYMDLSLENVLDDGTLFDFGHARFCPTGAKIDTFLIDPVYAAPEVFQRREASSASDVWALGVLAHQLLTGGWPHQHPFVPNYEVGNHKEHAVMHVADPYERGSSLRLGDLVAQMLEKDPSKRPTALEVAQKMGQKDNQIHRFVSKDRPKALLPMRAGVPHKGHINLIRRVIDMGYHPVVTLQKTYTWTPEDPLPKWVVAEMIRLEMQERGYGPDTFDIYPNPYGDARTHLMHFLSLPGWEDVEVIVSGNQGVWDLLQPIAEDRIFIDTRDICGDLTDSNGTILRTAVTEGDKSAIQRMLPDSILNRWGVDGILRMFPFHESLNVDFPVKVRVTYDGNTYPVTRYMWPMETVVHHCPGSSPVYVGHTYDMESQMLTVEYKPRA